MKNPFKNVHSSTFAPLTNTTSLPDPPTILPPGLTEHRRVIISSGINLFLNLATFILGAKLHGKTHPVFPPSVLGILASTVALGTIIIHISQRKKEDDSRAKHLPKLRITAMQLAVFLAICSIISSIVIITMESIGRHQVYFNLGVVQKASLITLSSLAIGSNAILAFIAMQLTWSPAHRAARLVMVATSILQVVVGTLLVTSNWQPWVHGKQYQQTDSLSTFALHQHVGTLETAVAILGFALCSAIRESNRIDRPFTRIIHFYLLLSGIIAILFLVLLIISIAEFYDKSLHLIYQKVTLAVNPILDGTALALLVVNFICTNYLQEPPASHLKVELLDVAALTDRQRDAYARLIDKHGKQVPGAPSGEAAMSLVQAYVGTSLPNMTCSVLRVYKAASRRSETVSRGSISRSHTLWGDRAWLCLDEEKMILRQVTLDEKPEFMTTAASPPALSKTQLKRLARKQATAAARGETLVFSEPRNPTQASHPIQLDDNFKSQLETTEAIVLLTTISEFDLTSSVKGWPGHLLKHTVGSKSSFKPLCVRLGLLATHFPFRESTFFCSATRRPVARSAAVLRAIDQWNRDRDSTARCAVLLNPTYQHEAVQHAIIPSGWRPSPLAPSHIVDLGPYKNMTMAEYMKAIKYRDQETAFKKAGGEIVESTTFTDEECKEVVRLWRNIASKRASSGDAAVLVSPDENFIKRLGTGVTGDRSLMFLRAGCHTVASCVLFRLGDTLTSDLQGLDYEHARPLKAYFVMMQHVIGIALREGRTFVDFGPTTAKPKVDIGSKSVPLIGAMCAVSPIISFVIGMAAKSTARDISAD